MPSSDYEFVSHWRVQATIQQVYDILSRPLELPRWWPDVYLDVREEGPGVFALHTKGRLPYTLRWKFSVTKADPPQSIALKAWGDLDGEGLWTLRQNGEFADIRYDWRIRAEKPLLRYLSFVLKPVFAANHRWAMSKGEESLRTEIARRNGG